jgi:hypothetical protein
LDDTGYMRDIGIGFAMATGLYCTASLVARFLKKRNAICGFVPPTPGYAACTRQAGHTGPCAHKFAKPVTFAIQFNDDKKNAG